MNVKLHPLVALLSLLAGAGCAAETAVPGNERSPGEQGSLQVAMQQQTADGAVYYLREATLHLAEVPLAGSDKVLCIQRANDYASQHDDGLWQFVVDFDCTVYLDSGV